MKPPATLSTAAVPPGVIAAAKRGVEALQALRQRDRLALSAAALALVAGMDFLVVLPLRDQRNAIESAHLASAHGLEAARSSREAEQRAFEDDLRSRQRRVTESLAAIGAAGKQDESLRFLLSRTLQGLPVAVLSLRALGVEEMEIAPADTPAPAPAPTDAIAAATPAAPASPAAPSVLYRHRYELRFGGGLPALLAALEALEQNTRPLRIERVRLHADASGALEASVVLMTLGPERTWLSL